MIGLIGGTGLGEALFGEATGREPVVDTPFGKPSGPIRLVEWHGLKVAILARHGAGHVFNPSQVPYRANIYALKSLGVTHVIAGGAVGSLSEEIHSVSICVLVVEMTTSLSCVTLETAAQGNSSRVRVRFLSPEFRELLGPEKLPNAVEAAKRQLEADAPGERRLFDRGDPAVHGDDELPAVGGDLLERFAVDAVAFVEAAGNVEIDVGVNEFECVPEDRRRGHAVDVIVAVDDNPALVPRGVEQALGRLDGVG